MGVFRSTIRLLRDWIDREWVSYSTEPETEHVVGGMDSLGDQRNDWTPLEDQWEKLCRFLEEASIEGLLQDPELADAHGWPRDLSLSDDEKEQIGEFTTERVSELLEIFQAHSVSPRAMGIYLMNTVLTGMAWERERIGR